jgi:hypothetical protein
MDPDRTVERRGADAAFVAALALALGDQALAERFLDSMLRAHLLTRPRDAEAFDPDALHGASGEW